MEQAGWSEAGRGWAKGGTMTVWQAMLFLD
jgi:hypothetical protein